MYDLTAVDDLSLADIQAILHRAKTLSVGESPKQRSGLAVNLFYEPSTRTRVSFTQASIKLGLATTDIIPERSSIVKGESPEETVATLGAIGANVVIVRSQESQLPERLRGLGPSIISAGAGCYEHPTQALLDAMTMEEASRNLSGATVVIVGDIVHSRVARSDARLLSRMGARVVLVGPPIFLPDGLADALGVEGSHDLEAWLPRADFLMALRIQTERLEHDASLPLSVYREAYGITEGRFAQTKPEAWFMHPGPANFGVEVDAQVAKGPRSLMRRQVKNGVFVRMAVLERVLAAEALSCAG